MKMINIKYVFGVLILMASTFVVNAKNCEISDGGYTISLDEKNSSFSISKGDIKFVLNAKLSEEVESAKQTAIEVKSLESGKAIEIKYKSGDTGKFMLLKNIPFVLYQGTLENKTDKTRVVNKFLPFDLKIKIDGDESVLRSISTAGLQPITGGKSGYMFLATGNKDTRNGVVCGWISTDKGSGAVKQSLSDSEVKIVPHVDYGDLRIPMKKSSDSEIVAIGYFDDIRYGLEEYANTIAQYYKVKLPSMVGVYCTWYHARGSDEDRILKNAKFASKELKPYGLSVMQIDDKWQGDAKNIRFDGKKCNGPYKVFVKEGEDYKSGMKHTADNLNKEGFVAGIWFMPFAGTHQDKYFADKQDLFFKDEKGNPYEVFWGGTEIDMSNPKAQEFLRDNIKRFRDWGYKYYKMDGLFTGLGVRIRYPGDMYKDDNLGELKRFDSSVTPVQSYRNAMKIIRDTAGSDTFLLGCCAPQNMRSLGATFGLVDAMRVGPDNGTQWNHWKIAKKIVGTLKAGPIYSGRVYFLNGRVWYNDPDPNYVRAQVPFEQAVAIASWVSLSGQLNSTSEDYYELPKERLEIIKRTLPSYEGKNVRPVDILENEPAQIWLLSEKIGKNDHNVLGLYNWDSKEKLDINYSMEKLGLSSNEEYYGFDFWKNKFVPKFKGKLNYEVSPASCNIVSLRKVKNHPQVVSTSRHITQGVVDLVDENWDAKTSTLSGKSKVVKNDTYEIRIFDTDGAKMKSATIVKGPKNTKISFSQDKDEIRVKILPSEDGIVEWKLNW